MVGYVPLWRCCKTPDWLELATVKTEKLTLFPQQFHSLIIFFPCVYSSSWNMQVETCLKHRAMLQHTHSGKKKWHQVHLISRNPQPHKIILIGKPQTAWHCLLFFLTKLIAKWQNELLKQTAVRLVGCVVCFKTVFNMYIYFAYCIDAIVLSWNINFVSWKKKSLG